MKKLVFWILICCISNLLFTPVSNAEIIHTWEGVIYVTDSSIKLTWDAVNGAAYYEVQALWIDPKDNPVVYTIGQFTDTTVTINKPKVGHFYLRVRACNDENECSPWSESIDPEKTQIKKPFYIYFKLSPTGDIIIE